ncbi:MAG TPA: AI-2E family transporter [Polyangiaceae bacterium]|jgi:predicted PurR-regulated permease PerM
MPTDEPRTAGIPAVPLSPLEKVEREHGTSETGVEVARTERQALGWAALAAIAAIVWIVLPIGVGVLLGTLLAFTVQPLFERLKPRLGAAWASLSIVVGSVLALAGTIGGLSWLLVAKGTALTQEWTASLGPGGPGGAVLGAVSGLTSRIGIPHEELAARARGLAESTASGAAGVAEAIAATTASAVLALFFAMLSMYFILRNWQSVALRAQETLPLRPDYTAGLFAEFRRVGRATLLGTMGSGLAQGVLATLGYWIAGVPEPLFFGAATAVASLVPAVGAALVWIPVGIVMILVGHTTGGVFELTWGAVLVAALCDYVIRPRLVGGNSALPSLFTFAALLGGVQVFGLKGLIVGPVVMSLAVSVLRLYAKEARKRRSDLAAR